eukprot:2669298-Rhodomonas_salina.1
MSRFFCFARPGSRCGATGGFSAAGDRRERKMQGGNKRAGRRRPMPLDTFWPSLTRAGLQLSFLSDIEEMSCACPSEVLPLFQELWIQDFNLGIPKTQDFNLVLSLGRVFNETHCVPDQQRVK